MNVRRNKLAGWIALQSKAAMPADEHSIAEMRAYPVREPGSGRKYTVVRLRSRSGITGWGEGPRATAAEMEQARARVTGKPATAFALTQTGTALDAAIQCAMLDIAARSVSTPVYRMLGGPTRFKARALARLHGETDAELDASLAVGVKAGFLAFEVPIPATNWRNQGQAFDKAATARMDRLRTSAPDNVDFVLSGTGALAASDAGAIASSLERFHLLWFDEPCPVTNLQTLKKVSEETVTPLGFGRDIRVASVFQDLLREGAVDVLRPSLLHEGITKIRQIATLAETYYIAVAPNHDGGPIATAAALHLAASLPNFFIQSVPWPREERDRRMRLEIVKEPIESAKDGFLALPNGPGLGITVNESALERYKEAAA